MLFILCAPKSFTAVYLPLSRYLSLPHCATAMNFHVLTVDWSHSTFSAHTHTQCLLVKPPRLIVSYVLLPSLHVYFQDTFTLVSYRSAVHHLFFPTLVTITDHQSTASLRDHGAIAGRLPLCQVVDLFLRQSVKSRQKVINLFIMTAA